MMLLCMRKKNDTTWPRQVVSSTSSYLAGKKLKKQCTQWEDNGKETGKRVPEPISKMGKIV